MTRTPQAVAGGGFLYAGPGAGVGAPGPEARRLGQAARDFVRGRVLAANARLEGGDLPFLRALLEEAGQAGLLGVEVPEGHGGLGCESDAVCAVVGGLGLQASFAVTCAAHLTIGTVPLLRHASDGLRSELLPQVAAGAKVGAYALTEPGAGSDAFALTTRAEPHAGGWRLTGAKSFITNAGIADHLVVFARVEGSGPTAFLLEARADGVTLGAEERKLGLHGSSTRQVFLDAAFVPGDRVLGGEGQGHRVALDALVVGRHKLGVLASGHLELLLEAGAQYAAERRQFGRPIGELGLVAGFLADAVAQAFALRALVGRVAPLVDPRGGDLVRAAVEAGLCKLTGSEALCEAADGMLQLHGGLGFLKGSWVEQSYRDVRVNRIYEGTDEVNRRAIAQGLLRGVRRGWLDPQDSVREARAALAAGPSAQDARGLADHCLRLARVAVAACESLGEGRDALEGALADVALGACQADAAASAADAAAGDARAALAQAAALLACARAVERAHAAYGTLAGALGADVPTRGLGLWDVMPRLDRPGLRQVLARGALAAGRDPLVDYDALRLPPC